MFKESPAYPVIKHFEEDTNPIFVVYGTAAYFPEVIKEFRDYFQGRRENISLLLDMERNKRKTAGETFFEILRQILNGLLDTIPTSDPQSHQLLQLFRMLTNLKERTRDYPSDEKLVEFVRFTYDSCYPALGEVFCQQAQEVIIAFKRFERVAKWGRKIHNYILDPLLKNLQIRDLRFVLFVQDDSKPSLFYGSNEESTREKITFYQLPALEDRDEIALHTAKYESLYREEYYPRYKEFTSHLHALLEGLIKHEGIPVEKIEFRTKTVESFVGKIRRKSYTDPFKEIKDCSGIRIITFDHDTIVKVMELIRKEFKIDEEHSMNKRNELKPTEFGYKSVHLIISLSKLRTEGSEWKRFANLSAEIQIRSLLEHAWAVTSHKYDYKASSPMPDESRRRLSRANALLELADEEFAAIRDRSEESQKDPESE